MQKLGILTLTFFLLSGCIADKSSLSISMKDKRNTSPMSVSSVQIVNNQLVIKGTNLNETTDVSISGNSLNENFSIESKSATQVIANGRHSFSFDISKAFSLLISNAEASATFAIDFSLCNGTLNNAGFNCTIAAHDNDVLSYDQSTNKWVPRSLNGLSYQGTWDAANDPLPTTAGVGNYFIVSSVNAPYGVGDWIVWNGTTFDQVAMPTVVTSTFGRSGAVVATEGDYTLDQLLDVDLSVAPVNGKVLKYNGTKWVAADDNAGGAGGAGSVASSEIADGSIMNADINASAAIDYSKLNVPAGAILYSKLTIADGDIPAAKITGLPAALPSGGTTLQYFAGDKTLQTLNTAAVPESGTNYYFTDVRARAATLTGLASNTGAIAATDTVLGAFGKLLGTQGDYVSKSANTTILGKITIDNTVGELHVPTLPTTGGDLTQAANAGYVENYVESVVESFGQWIKTGLKIGFTGDVGIGVVNPGAKLHVMNGATAFEKTSVDTSGPTFSFWKHRNYAATVSGDELGYIGFFGHDGTGLGRSAFILGSADGAPSAGSVPGSLRFFTTTSGSTDSTEKMHIAANGNVGIGTASPQATLSVAGTIASTPPAPIAGAAVDLSKSNTQVLTNVGQTAITLSNMVHGGSYTLIIQDTTSRIYTFTGCATSKFQPANIATISLTHTIYNIMTVYNGTNYDCYITWSSGYN